MAQESAQKQTYTQEAKELLETIGGLSIEDKRLILASLRGMLLVADANKEKSA